MKKLIPLFCIAIVVTGTAVVGIWLMCREHVCVAEESLPIIEHDTMVGETSEEGKAGMASS